MSRQFRNQGNPNGPMLTSPYGDPPKVDLEALWPHCDARVLHPPGACHFCDGRSDLQEVRKAWGIAFTGQEPEEGGLPCPADHARPPGSKGDHRRWPGNRPDDGDSMYRTVRVAAEDLFEDAQKGFEGGLTRLGFWRRMVRGLRRWRELDLP